MNKFETARLKYKPQHIKYILIAETPPKAASDRFFYFENVTDKDSLFLETMKVLYPKLTINLEPKDIRRAKASFLLKFQSDGFYLIDSLNEPFEEKYLRSRKIKLLILGQNVLLNKIRELCSRETKVILIAPTVFDANCHYLKNNGVNIIQNDFIDFAGFGRQKKYREKLGRVLKVNPTPQPLT